MPLFSAIGAVIGAISTFIGSLGAIGSFVLRTAIGIGLNLLAQAIAGKPKDPTFSINGTLQSGGDLPRSFIIGRTATAGSLVFANTWGKDGDTPNAYLTQVIALSDYPVSSLDEFWVNGEKCALGGNTSHGQTVTGYPDSLWVRFYDGTQTVADPLLVSSASNAARQWPSSRVGRGIAYVVVTARVSKNMFSGIPAFKFALSGAKLYDISKDTSMGGVGTQRLDNPATWGGDGDHLPVVQAYNLLRGLTYNGKWFYGLQGLAAARLPSANWIAQINKCRATIAGASGLEPTYRSGGEIQIDAPLASALEAINTTCQGRISEVGGVYSMFVGAPDAPVVTFTDGDILSSEEQSFTPFFGLTDTINGISATYPSPSDGWAAKTAPPLYRTDLEALHGNRRLMADVPLDFVPYDEQVQRLMKSALEEGQRARRHTLVLPPEFWPFATPGAILAWNSERNGYVGKMFRVDGASDRANLDVMIDITEVDPSDYDWDSETDFDVPVDGAVGPIRPQPQPIVDWTAAPDSVKDSDGVNRRPAIRLTWDNTDGRLDDVIGIEFEVRLESSFVTVYGGRTDQPEVGSLLISQGLLPLTLYGVRGRYLAGSERPTLWSNWIPVTTPDIRISDVTAYLEGIGRDVYETLQELRADHDNLRARLEMIAAGAADATGASVDLHTVARRFQNATAIAMREMTASIEETEAGLVAQASIIDAVQAEVGEISADGLRRIEVTAGTGDVVARLTDMVRASIGDAWVGAGTVTEVGFTGGNPALPFSRIIHSANQFIVTDGTATSIPLVYEGGVLKLAVANIGTVTAGTIRSPNSKFIMTLAGSGKLEWFE